MDLHLIQERLPLQRLMSGAMPSSSVESGKRSIDIGNAMFYIQEGLHGV